MKEHKMRNYIYKCICGFELKVSLDFGTPQEKYTCRMCGEVVNRKENW